ncbi:MAG: VCBS repeat-containing protein [Saprospiraceae bacterium]|nr:VCBS repeat-containing protein [Pyrinomonadaceae bacterium]
MTKFSEFRASSRRSAFQIIAAVGLGAMLFSGMAIRVKAAPAAIIYDNGALATGATSRSGVASPAGSQWSETSWDFGATTVTNTLAGVGCQRIGATTNNRCADDFNVPVGQTWTINQVIVFVYQSGFAGLTSPVTAANVRIFNGIPNAGGTVIFGDATTNRLGASTDSGLFRIFNSGPPLNSAPGTTRRIWQVNITVSPALVLTAGNYWVDFQVDAGALGNFAPTNTIVGTRGAPFYNSLQSINGGVAYAESFDDGNPVAAPNIVNDFPFKLDGTISGAPIAPRSRALDFNGDNKTDYAVARSASAVTQSTWLIQTNGGPTSGVAWGNGVGFTGGDKATPADFDGDGKTDIAVWRPGAPTVAAFYILNSSNSTVRIETFGQIGDDVTVVGDYDGDEKADPAVYRDGTGGGQSTFFYRGSVSNPSGNVSYVPFGIQGDIAVPGDFDGDKKFDFHVARNAAGQLIHYRLATTAGFSGFSYGLNTDKLVTGDFDADGKTDIGALRINGSNYDWYILRSATNRIWIDRYGNPATDYITLGDYDGDNKTDIVVWRSGQPADQTNFFLRNTFTSPLQNEWGQSAGPLTPPDYPLATWNVK